MRVVMSCLCALIIPGIASAQDSTEVRAVSAVIEQFHNAVALADFERAEALLAPDMRQFAMLAGDLRGRDEVLAWWDGVANQRHPGRSRLLSRTSIEALVVLPQRAFARGLWEVASGSAPSAPLNRFNFLVTLRREADVWKIVEHGFNNRGRNFLP